MVQRQDTMPSVKLSEDERRRKKNERDRERRKRKRDDMTEDDMDRYNAEAAERMRKRRAAMSDEAHKQHLAARRRTYAHEQKLAARRKKYAKEKASKSKESEAKQTPWQKRGMMEETHINELVALRSLKNEMDRKRREEQKKTMTEEEKKAVRDAAAERKRKSRAALSSEEHSMVLKERRSQYAKLPIEIWRNLLQNRRDRYQHMTHTQRKEYCQKQSRALRERRARYTPEEKKEEMIANSIRNSLTFVRRGRNRTCQTPGAHLYIQKISKDASERQRNRIITKRTMQLAKLHTSRVKRNLDKEVIKFQSWNSTAERNYILQKQSIAHQPQRYVLYVSKQLEKAKSKFEEACTALKESKSKYALAVKAYNKAIAEAKCGPANVADDNSPDAIGTETNSEPHARTTIMASDSSVDASSNQTKQILTEEDVADDFIHQSTGQYRSIADGVPDHINPETGHYKYGYRKCSKCNEYKFRNYFTEEEAEKKADKRQCVLCMDTNV